MPHSDREVRTFEFSASTGGEPCTLVVEQTYICDPRGRFKKAGMRQAFLLIDGRRQKLNQEAGRRFVTLDGGREVTVEDAGFEQMFGDKTG